jgi:polyisoprenoid-binding protein YceI
MAGVSLPVTAHGRLRGPIDLGDTQKIALSLETTVDRTAFGMNWQMELPSGGQALGNEVKLVVDLELVRS